MEKASENLTAAGEDPGGFLTVAQAAQSCGLSRSSVYEACKNKLLAHYRMSGTDRRGNILIRPADLDRFIESRRVEAGEVPAPRRFRFTHRRP